MSAVAVRTSPAALDVAAIRDQFPILAQRVHGQPLVYAVKVELSGTVEYIKCVGREDEGFEEEAQYTVARVEKVR